jgi:hypothetical protein
MKIKIISDTYLLKAAHHAQQRMSPMSTRARRMSKSMSHQGIRPISSKEKRKRRGMNFVR